MTIGDAVTGWLLVNTAIVCFGVLVLCASSPFLMVWDQWKECRASKVVKPEPMPFSEEELDEDVAVIEGRILDKWARQEDARWSRNANKAIEQLIVECGGKVSGEAT